MIIIIFSPILILRVWKEGLGLAQQSCQENEYIKKEDQEHDTYWELSSKQPHVSEFPQTPCGISFCFISDTVYSNWALRAFSPFIAFMRTVSLPLLQLLSVQPSASSYNYKLHLTRESGVTHEHAPVPSSRAFCFGCAEESQGISDSTTGVEQVLRPDWFRACASSVFTLN